jgi:hypothetical protein
MENMTQPIMQGWMNQAHDPLKAEDRTKPSGIQTLPAFIVRNHVGVGSREPSPSTDLFPSWYKASQTATKSKQTMDKVSNKLATDCTPVRARQDVTDSAASSFSGDRFAINGASTTQQDDIHKCDDTKPSIQLLSATKNTVSLIASAGTHPLSSTQFPGSINIVIDGQTVQSYPVDDSQSGTKLDLSYSYAGAGSKQVSVTVVDSVLYDASDQSSAVDFSGASITLNANRVANAVSFSWSGGNGPYTVHYAKTAGGGDGTCTTNASICTKTGLSAGGYTAYVIDDDGNKSDNVTF